MVDWKWKWFKRDDPRENTSNHYPWKKNWKDKGSIFWSFKVDLQNIFVECCYIDILKQYWRQKMYLNNYESKDK